MMFMRDPYRENEVFLVEGSVRYRYEDPFRRGFSVASSIAHVLHGETPDRNGHAQHRANMPTALASDKRLQHVSGFHPLKLLERCENNVRTLPRFRGT